MTVVAILQARASSTRLPGKVLKPILGEPMLARQIERVRRARGFSELVIATSDNPRTEDPERILADVEQGLGKLEHVTPERLEETENAYVSLVDRRSAIELAIRIARAGDTVLIAGKGHEDYQIIGRERRPFSDGDEARRALENRSAGRGTEVQDGR